ncbi:MAG: CHAT domain-containing protein [Acidobacteriota bacterium]
MLLINRRVWIVSFALLSLLVMFISMVTKADQSSPSVQGGAYSSTEPIVLEQGKTIKRELAGGEVHSYEIKLTAGQFLHIIVEQKGIDVEAVLFGVDGKQIIQVDSPNGTQGSEPILFIAEATGNYLLEVHSLVKTAFPGRYEIKILDLRTAISEDMDRITGCRIFAEGALIRRRGTVEAFVKAIEKYKEAIQFFQASNDHSREAATLHSIGTVYSALGEKQKALDYLSQSLLLKKAIGDRAGEAATLNNIGLVYDTLGEKQKALDYYNQTLLLENAVNNRAGEAVALNNIGRIYDMLGEKQKALDYLSQSLLLKKAIGDHAGEATTLLNISKIYYSLGEKQRALDYCNQILPIVRAIGVYHVEAATLISIGSIYYSLGEKQRALDYYNQALSRIETIGSYSLQTTIFYCLARFERDNGNLIESQRKMEKAIKLYESLRTSIINQDLRATFFAERQERYEFYIDLLMQLHQSNSFVGYDALALEASERARARGLLELLTESRADIRQGVALDLIEKEKGLQQRLIDKTELLVHLKNNKGKEAEIAVLEREVDLLTAEFQQVQTEIRQKSLRYKTLTQPQPLSLKEIQEQVLDNDTLLLEYSLGKENSYLWAVTRTSISSYKLPKREEIETLAKNVYQLVSSYENALTNTENTYWQAATKLSQVILEPVAKQLGKKRLLIVSDGVLQYIPFAALPLPTNTPARKERKAAVIPTPLFLNHEIISEPSASTVAVLRRELSGRQPAAKAVAVLADPVFSADDMRVKRVPEKAAYSNTQSTEPVSESIKELSLTRSLLDVYGRGTLARLHFSRDEADAIRALVGTSEYKEALDFDANLATATSAELGQYRYLHFASHGLIDSKYPELSGIVLSLVDEHGKTRNGMLQLADIYNLELSADLVVLSACRTGLGKEIKGEGLVGLTRGFMYAGSARVMASLWDIEDRATAKLIEHFYKGLIREKLRPAAALQKAQRTMWKSGTYRFPYYWAGLQLSGEWR